jgi:hypothetical protein
MVSFIFTESTESLDLRDMGYTIIAPLGKRIGRGTFDTLFDSEKYSSMEQADQAGDLVVINFVQDSEGIIYFEGYHTKHPDNKRYIRLQIQHFPFGIDIFDDAAAIGMAEDFLNYANNG